MAGFGVTTEDYVPVVDVVVIADVEKAVVVSMVMLMLLLTLILMLILMLMLFLKLMLMLMVDGDADAVAGADAALSLEILPREVDVRLISGMNTIRHFRVPNPKKLIQL
jgi:hypothetical protein